MSSSKSECLRISSVLRTVIIPNWKFSVRELVVLAEAFFPLTPFVAKYLQGLYREASILVEAARFCAQYLAPRVGLYLLEACGPPNAEVRSLYLQAMDSFFGTACHVGDIAACNTIVRIGKTVVALPENNWSRAMFLEEATRECVRMLLSPPFLIEEVLNTDKRYGWAKAALLCASYNAKRGDSTLAEWIISKSLISAAIKPWDIVSSQWKHRILHVSCDELFMYGMLKTVDPVISFDHYLFGIRPDLLIHCFRNTNLEALEYFGRVLEVKKTDVILSECAKSGIEKLWPWLETIGFTVSDFRDRGYWPLKDACSSSTGAQWIITKFELTKEDLINSDLVQSACMAGNIDCVNFIFDNYGTDLALSKRRESIWALIPAFLSSSYGAKIAPAKVARCLLTRFNTAMNLDNHNRRHCFHLAISQQDVALIRVLCELSFFSVSEISWETFAHIVSECMDDPVVPKEDVGWFVDSRGMTSEESRALGRSLLSYRPQFPKRIDLSHDCTMWIVAHFKLTPDLHALTEDS
ncbi:hypothetical protein Pelo_1971 [Pelomyxa schiedti]|nr:hypothetical protein Pelo_1971 [Pelomyxa schiedti]